MFGQQAPHRSINIGAAWTGIGASGALGVCHLGDASVQGVIELCSKAGRLALHHPFASRLAC